MRNLKKALSLALALVMLLGMMMVGAGAATEINDIDSVKADNQEAVKVMNAIDIIKGDENGNFNPDGTLKRAEAAVIISKVLLTAPVVEKLVGMESRFTDMAGEYAWAIPYVEACANAEIIVGNGDGTFDPASEVTGVAFAKMLLVTLGFDADNYNGKSNWELLVLQDAIKAGLDANSVAITGNDLSRADAAQMAFNALLYSPTGNVWKVGNLEFDNLKDAALYAAVKGGGAEPVKAPAKDSLAVTRFGLSEGKGKDAYGREVKTWELEGVKDPVYTAAESIVKPVKTYTEDTAADKIAEALKDYKVPYGAASDDPLTNAAISSNVDLTTARAKIMVKNGAAAAALGTASQSAAAAIAAQTGKGYTVEVYADSNKVITKVIVIVPEVVTVTKVDEAKNTFTAGGVTIDEKSDFAGLIGQVQKGDKLVAVKQGNKFLSLEPAEIVTGTMTFLDKGVATVAGQKISNFEDKTDLGAGLLGEEIDVVLVNGYAWSATKVGSANANTEAGDGYIWVTNIWVEATGKYGATNVIYALGVLADGTTKTLTLEALADNDTVTGSNYGLTGNLTAKSTPSAGNVLALSNSTLASLVDDETSAKQGLYKYYEATVANKGAILTVIDGANAKKIAGGANTGAAATAPQIDDKFVATDVAMVWVSGSADKLAGNVTGHEAIANSNDYYYILDENGRIAVIFLKADASVAESDLVFVTTAGGQTIYTDKDGKTQKGYQVTYYAAGEAESKTMVVDKDNWNPATMSNKFCNATANGTGFELVAQSGTSIKYDAATHSMYNGAMIVNGVAGTVDVTDALIIDLANGKDDKITSVEELEAYINAAGVEKKVTMIVKDGKAETVYLMKNTDGLKTVWVSKCSEIFALPSGMYKLGAAPTACDCTSHRNDHSIGDMGPGKKDIIYVSHATKGTGIYYCAVYKVADDAADALKNCVTTGFSIAEGGASFGTTTLAGGAGTFKLTETGTYTYVIYKGADNVAQEVEPVSVDAAENVIAKGTFTYTAPGVGG